MTQTFGEQCTSIFGNESEDDEAEDEEMTEHYTQPGNNRQNNNSNNNNSSQLMGRPFVGLVNQTATCYLNSLIQALYFTPEFRKGLYSLSDDELGIKYEKEAKQLNELLDTNKIIPKKEDIEKICNLPEKYSKSRAKRALAKSNNDVNKAIELLSNGEVPKVRFILIEFRRLFSILQTGKVRDVKTKNLTDSFGWRSGEVSNQHDAHELNRILLDAIERSLDGTSKSNLVNQIFEGVRTYRTFCLECSYVSPRDEKFLDLIVEVENLKNLQESLQREVKPSYLVGDNKYLCDKCNKKSNAKRTVCYKKFPNVLTVALKRFIFDLQTFQRTKYNKEFKFPLIIDMAPYLEENLEYQIHKTENDKKEIEKANKEEKEKKEMVNESKRRQEDKKKKHNEDESKQNKGMLAIEGPSMPNNTPHKTPNSNRVNNNPHSEQEDRQFINTYLNEQEKIEYVLAKSAAPNSYVDPRKFTTRHEQQRFSRGGDYTGHGNTFNNNSNNDLYGNNGYDIESQNQIHESVRKRLDFGDSSSSSDNNQPIPDLFDDNNNNNFVVSNQRNLNHSQTIHFNDNYNMINDLQQNEEFVEQYSWTKEECEFLFENNPSHIGIYYKDEKTGISRYYPCYATVFRKNSIILRFINSIGNMSTHPASMTFLNKFPTNLLLIDPDRFAAQGTDALSSNCDNRVKIDRLNKEVLLPPNYPKFDVWKKELENKKKEQKEKEKENKENNGKKENSQKKAENDKKDKKDKNDKIENKKDNKKDSKKKETTNNTQSKDSKKQSAKKEENKKKETKKNEVKKNEVKKDTKEENKIENTNKNKTNNVVTEEKVKESNNNNTTNNNSTTNNVDDEKTNEKSSQNENKNEKEEKETKEEKESSESPWKDKKEFDDVDKVGYKLDNGMIARADIHSRKPDQIFIYLDNGYQRLHGMKYEWVKVPNPRLYPPEKVTPIPKDMEQGGIVAGADNFHMGTSELINNYHSGGNGYYRKVYKMELSKYDPNSKHLYGLTGVVIHSGSPYSGHYHALIRDFMKEGAKATEEKNKLKSKLKNEKNTKNEQNKEEIKEEKNIEKKEKEEKNEKKEENENNEKNDKNENENKEDISEECSDDWYDLNDSNTKLIPINEIAKQYGGEHECAYMLVYRKIEDITNYKPPQLPKSLKEYINEYNENIKIERRKEEEERHRKTFKILHPKAFDVEENGTSLTLRPFINSLLKYFIKHNLQKEFDEKKKNTKKDENSEKKENENISKNEQNGIIKEMNDKNNTTDNKENTLDENNINIDKLVEEKFNKREFPGTLSGEFISNMVRQWFSDHTIYVTVDGRKSVEKLSKIIRYELTNKFNDIRDINGKYIPKPKENKDEKEEEEPQILYKLNFDNLRLHSLVIPKVYDSINAIESSVSINIATQLSKQIYPTLEMDYGGVTITNNNNNNNNNLNDISRTVTSAMQDHINNDGYKADNEDDYDSDGDKNMKDKNDTSNSNSNSNNNNKSNAHKERNKYYFYHKIPKTIGDLAYTGGFTDSRFFFLWDGKQVNNKALDLSSAKKAPIDLKYYKLKSNIIYSEEKDEEKGESKEDNQTENEKFLSKFDIIERTIILPLEASLADVWEEAKKKYCSDYPEVLDIKKPVFTLTTSEHQDRADIWYFVNNSGQYNEKCFNESGFVDCWHEKANPLARFVFRNKKLYNNKNNLSPPLHSVNNRVRDDRSHSDDGMNYSGNNHYMYNNRLNNELSSKLSLRGNLSLCFENSIGLDDPNIRTNAFSHFISNVKLITLKIENRITNSPKELIFKEPRGFRFSSLRDKVQRKLKIPNHKNILIFQKNDDGDTWYVGDLTHTFASSRDFVVTEGRTPGFNERFFRATVVLNNETNKKTKEERIYIHEKQSINQLKKQILKLFKLNENESSEYVLWELSGGCESSCPSGGNPVTRITRNGDQILLKKGKQPEEMLHKNFYLVKDIRNLSKPWIFNHEVLPQMQNSGIVTPYQAIRIDRLSIPKKCTYDELRQRLFSHKILEDVPSYQNIFLSWFDLNYSFPISAPVIFSGPLSGKKTQKKWTSNNAQLMSVEILDKSLEHISPYATLFHCYLVKCIDSKPDNFDEDHKTTEYPIINQNEPQNDTIIDIIKNNKLKDKNNEKKNNKNKNNKNNNLVKHTTSQPNINGNDDEFVVIDKPDEKNNNTKDLSDKKEEKDNNKDKEKDNKNDLWCNRIDFTVEMPVGYLCDNGNVVLCNVIRLVKDKKTNKNIRMMIKVDTQWQGSSSFKQDWVDLPCEKISRPPETLPPQVTQGMMDDQHGFHDNNMAGIGGEPGAFNRQTTDEQMRIAMDLSIQDQINKSENNNSNINSTQIQEQQMLLNMYQNNNNTESKNNNNNNIINKEDTENIGIHGGENGKFKFQFWPPKVHDRVLYDENRKKLTYHNLRLFFAKKYNLNPKNTYLALYKVTQSSWAVINDSLDTTDNGLTDKPFNIKPDASADVRILGIFEIDITKHNNNLPWYFKRIDRWPEPPLGPRSKIKSLGNRLNDNKFVGPYSTYQNRPNRRNNKELTIGQDGLD